MPCTRTAALQTIVELDRQRKRIQICRIRILLRVDVGAVFTGDPLGASAIGGIVEGQESEMRAEILKS